MFKFTTTHSNFTRLAAGLAALFLAFGSGPSALASGSGTWRAFECGKSTTAQAAIIQWLLSAGAGIGFGSSCASLYQNGGTAGVRIKFSYNGSSAQNKFHGLLLNYGTTGTTNTNLVQVRYIFNGASGHPPITIDETLSNLRFVRRVGKNLLFFQALRNASDFDQSLGVENLVLQELIIYLPPQKKLSLIFIGNIQVTTSNGDAVIPRLIDLHVGGCDEVPH